MKMSKSMFIDHDFEKIGLKSESTVKHRAVLVDIRGGKILW